MNEYQVYIKRCIELATNGLGYVSPNPMVGAVLVHNGRIIGEGYHHQPGKAHAEVNAINAVFEKYPSDAEQLLKESTLYVNLEPCSHQGRTPPCSNLIIKHQIPKVVIGMIDPFEKVHGKGMELLRNAGIEVIINILEQECKTLNKRFITYNQQQRPYIILKWAETHNGYFAPSDGTKCWITGKRAKQLVHKWRSEEDAVLVGTNTALIDNPQLTVREWNGRNPIRLVIDRNLKLPKDLAIFDQSAKTFIYNETLDKVEGNWHYTTLEFSGYEIQYIIYHLYITGVQSVIIEGGKNLLDQFITHGLWDESRVFIGNTHITNGIDAPKMQVSPHSREIIDNDILYTYYNNNVRF